MVSANSEVGCSPKTRWVTIAILAAVHLAAASAIALIPFGGREHYYQNRPVIGVILGILFAQMSLTAAWCTLGPGKFFLRVPFSLMAASLTGMAMAAFTFKSSGGNEFWLFAALTLVGWLLLQPPLWIASGIYHCSVRLPDEESRKKAGSAQFSLAHMLLWTLGVAVILGIGRMALRDFHITDSRVWRAEDVAIMVVILGLNFLLAMPIIFFVLRRSPTVSVLLLSGVWSLILGGVEFVLLSAIAGPPPGDAIVLVLLLNLVHGLVLAGSLIALTSVGYRLRPKSSHFGQIQPFPSKD